MYSLIALAVLSATPEAAAAPAGFPAHIYYESEGIYSLRPVEKKLPGFFGRGYRTISPDYGTGSLDKTYRLYAKADEFVVWIRAYVERVADRRVAVAFLNGNETTHLGPTHGAPKREEGRFCWQRAGTIRRDGRSYYTQLRLLSVDGSHPIIDAILLTADKQIVPKEDVRPIDDPDFTLGDGEGSTRINRPMCVAGESVELEMTYVVGSRGIECGGAMQFFLPHSWPVMQFAEPETEGYTTVTVSRPGLRFTLDAHAPGKGARAYSGQLRHTHEAFVRITEGNPEPGDEVRVTYRAAIQRYPQGEYDFVDDIRAWYASIVPLGVATDANGDGIFRTLPPERSHRFQVVAGDATQFFVTLPSVVKKGESFPIHIAAADKYRNLAKTFRGKVRLEWYSLDDPEQKKLSTLLESIELEPDDEGAKRLPDAARLDAPGYYAVRAIAGNGDIQGLSNAVKVTADEPRYRIYWGDMHCHQRRCDGLRTFEDAATHARDYASLDFLVLSPHACYITESDVAELLMVDEAFNSPDRFVTFFGYEWAGARQGSSHSVLFSPEALPACLRGFGGGNVVKGREALFEALEEHGFDRVLEVPHHLRGVTIRDTKYQRGLEIYSQWGPHEPGAVANWREGAVACVFGGSDNHTGQPGVQGWSNRWHIHNHLAGWTGVLVENGRLRRNSLFDAMLARRTIATASERIIADFRLNGRPMGDVVEMASPTEPRRVEIEVANSTPVTRIELMKNGQPIAAWHPNRCVVQVEHLDNEPHGDSQEFYHVRIRTVPREDADPSSENIGREQAVTAWLTPIWVRYKHPAPSPETAIRKALEKAENFALNKPVTVGFPHGITAGKPELLTDGRLDGHLGHGVEGLTWVQVDLGKTQPVAVVRLWNYFRDGRTFQGNRLVVSPTGKFHGEETVIFDSEKSGEYPEQPDGRLWVFEPVEARYVRSYLNGNTANAGSQWVELEVFGRPFP